MAFKNDIPNFASITNGEYYYNSIPNSFWNGLESLITRFSEDSSQLRGILDYIAELVICQKTTNWGWNFLVNDVPFFVGKLRDRVDKGHIDCLMDLLGTLAIRGNDNIEIINEYLADNMIGYYCTINNHMFNRRIIWHLKEKNASLENIAIIQTEVKSQFQQAYEEYTQAMETLKRSNDERARKDVVRSCINAMESIIKICGEDDEIGQATKNLKSKKWGKDYFIKQGLALFNKIHELYPDLRHGSQEVSEMPLEETE